MHLGHASIYSSKSVAPCRPSPVVFMADSGMPISRSLEAAILAEGWQPAVCASAKEFLSRSQVDAPCCLVLNMTLPDINGFDLLRQMGADRSDMPVIAVADQSDVLIAVGAMKAGARDFFIKPFDDGAMIEAIRSAIVLSQAAQQRQNRKRVLRERFELLSKREREVVTLVVKGLMNKQVGGELDISEITVKAHRGRAMQKMRATSLVDLVNMTAELDLTGRL